MRTGRSGGTWVSSNLSGKHQLSKIGKEAQYEIHCLKGNGPIWNHVTSEQYIICLRLLIEYAFGPLESHTHNGYGFLAYWAQTYYPLRHSKWKFFNLVLFFRKSLCRGSFDNSVIVKEHFLEIFVRQISD